mmetsp:Transcript_20315/g.48184  ORF Transcript_20315/g.48184 Transcript_20315/m.48184 type:complete len:290 (+) Transcript_20315:104-973(+)
MARYGEASVDEHSNVLHGSFLFLLAPPSHLTAFRLDPLRPSGAEHFGLHLVAYLVDLGVHFEHERPQDAVAGKPIIQEIKEEHDLDQPTNPGLDVRVPRHVDLLVDPVQRIEHSVAPKHHHVEASAQIFVDPLPVAEDVLRHHGKALNELRERPEHLHEGIVIGQEQSGKSTGHQDDRHIAGVVPASIGAVELVEEDQHDNGRGDVRELEEDQVEGLGVVKQVQVPSDEHDAVQNLRGPRNPCNRLVPGNRHQKGDDPSQMKVVADISKNIPGISCEVDEVGRAMELIH